MRVHVPLALREDRCGRNSGRSIVRISSVCRMLAGLLFVLAESAANAQYRPANIPDLHERSGLVMRYAGVREQLPPDPLRDNFYNTRYADRGLIKHPDGIKDQGLYGLGWKAACS